MEEFNFFFGFYSLLLGLAVAAITRGLAMAVTFRDTARVGPLIPLLGIFLLQDLASVWIFAWDTREHLSVNYLSLYGAMVVAILYNFAAALAFPARVAEGTDLEAHYWSNKRLVFGAQMLASLLTLCHGVFVEPEVFDWWGFWPLQLIYWGPLLALLLTRNRRMDVGLLGFLVIGYLAEPTFEIAGWLQK